MNLADPDTIPANEARPPASPAVETAPSVAPMATRRVARIGFVVLVVLVGLLVVGIVPRRTVQHQLAADTASAASAIPIIAVARAQRPTTANTLLLPGTMEALHEAAMYARVSGYVRRWHADIGSAVRAGQLLADIDVPELEQSVLQARAQVAQMQSALVLAQSNLERWRQLAADSAVTVQELAQMQQASDAAEASVHAAEANLRGLMATQGFTQIRAPFDGVVVARNVDYGSLITAGGASSTPLTAGGSQSALATSVAAASLFRIAQTDTMRVYVNIPQPYVASIRPGLSAELVVQDLGGRSFSGAVVRTAGAVDPDTRTLLAEVDVPNPARVLLPGMYAQIRITLQRVDAPLVIPSTALVSRSSGPQVIELIPSDSATATVRYQDVQVARDYGSTLEIVSGLADSALVAMIGSQILTEGQSVRIAMPAADSAGRANVVRAQPAATAPRPGPRAATP